MQGTSGPSVKVGIVGASGYTGAELLRLLSIHPNATVTYLTSRQFRGKQVKEIFPHLIRSPFEELSFDEFNPERAVELCDVVFCCLPHRASFPAVKALMEASSKVKVIDFSADFRFNSFETYESVYGVEHGARELFKEAVYGLPELFREQIKRSRLVANPGCYPTSAILALYPAVEAGAVDTDHPVVVDSKSGVSGAGRKESVTFTFCEVNEDFRAYSVDGHRHGPEIAEKLGLKSVRFTPHLVPMNRGILTTAYFKTELSKEELQHLYENRYKGEFFVRVRTSPPRTHDVAGTNFCDIYVTKDKESGLAVVVSAIDNLGKGASSQAVQNMNLMFGLPEEAGLKLFSLWI